MIDPYHDKLLQGYQSKTLCMSVLTLVYSISWLVMPLTLHLHSLLAGWLSTLSSHYRCMSQLFYPCPLTIITNNHLATILTFFVLHVLPSTCQFVTNLLFVIWSALTPVSWWSIWHCQYLLMSASHRRQPISDCPISLFNNWSVFITAVSFKLDFVLELLSTVSWVYSVISHLSSLVFTFHSCHLSDFNF